MGLVLLSAPISYLQAIVLGLLQGVSELFPISSLGHSVILPSLLGWDLHQRADYFLAFLVALHMATALTLLGFFWRDWVRIVRGLVRSVRDRGLEPDNVDGRLGWLLIVGTIPAGLLGLALQNPLQRLFGSPRAAAAFLVANGVLLLAADRLRRRPVRPAATDADGDGDDRIATTTGWRGALGVGTAQALALVPGFSRSGAAISGGLAVGLDHEDAARYAFLLATPIIGAAGLLKLPTLFGSQGNGVRGQALVAAVCAAAAAYVSVRFLMRWFETNRLTPFAVYSIVAGLACSVYLAR
ncbi:MAG TPA: undecaprenyl-diphosphate phosphatase [Gaiellales bacterium]|nr:undecaprenyl-diphosphate phosphatase [Gaiellales bacterium]